MSLINVNSKNITVLELQTGQYYLLIFDLGGMQKNK